MKATKISSTAQLDWLLDVCVDVSKARLSKTLRVRDLPAVIVLCIPA